MDNKNSYPKKGKKAIPTTQSYKLVKEKKYESKCEKKSIFNSDNGLTYIPPPSEDSKFPTVSVIVTICSGESYDDLFLSQPQKAPEGKVSVFHLDPIYSGDILSLLEGKTLLESDRLGKIFIETANKLLSEIKLVNTESTLFNWECCSGYEDVNLDDESYNYEDNVKKSLVAKTENLKLIKHLLDNKHMTMFSDFAVDALINDWDVNLIGPNPFKKIGTCHSQIELGFIPNDLKECPSVQLQLVGQLCEKGSMVIHAMSDTIVFGLIDEKMTSCEQYELNLLTIVTKTDSNCELNNCEIAAKRGTIGHVMLNYKSGGRMLLSAGHWVEMTKFDVDLVNLENVVEEFGGLYKDEWSSINNNNQCSEKEKYNQYQDMASRMIKKSAPCTYSNNKNFQKQYKK